MMNIEEFVMIFGDEDSDEFLKFDRVQTKLSSRPDLHAFILLNSLIPGTSDIVASAHHDEIYLDIEGDDLAPLITKEQLIDLIRCGVRYDEENESLCMFV